MNNENIKSTNEAKISIPETWEEKFKDTELNGTVHENPYANTNYSNESWIWQRDYDLARKKYSLKLNAQSEEQLHKDYERENNLLKAIRDITIDYGNPFEFRTAVKAIEELQENEGYSHTEISLAILFSVQRVSNTSLW